MNEGYCIEGGEEYFCSPKCLTTKYAPSQWLELYGDAIYGTRKGPVSPQEWGATTQKGDVVYVHVLNHEVLCRHTYLQY